MSPPYVGFGSDEVGVGLGRESSLDRVEDDVAWGHLLRADTVAEDEGSEPRYVVGLDGRASLGRGACLRPGQEMPRCAGARAQPYARGLSRLADDADAETRQLLAHVDLVDDLLRDEEGTLTEKRRDVAEHVWDYSAVGEGECAELAVFVAVLELYLD